MRASRAGLAATIATFGMSMALVAAPAGAVDASSNLNLTGSVQGAVNVIKTVCDSHVASAKHHFFFDIGGTGPGGTFLFTGKVSAYHGPGTYRTFTGLVMAGGHYLVAHNTGTISVGGGANSARVRATLRTAPGAPPATVTISGRFTCTSYTSQ